MMTPTLKEAYEARVKKNGFSHQEIGKLQVDTGLPMTFLKEHILMECRAGNATLATGDWSWADDETRAGMIEVRGRKMILVKFKYWMN